MTQDPKWLKKAKENLGKKESDKTFGAWLSSFWGKVGLPGWKSIVGSKNAWCGLFIGVMLTVGGYAVAPKGASAKAWDTYGQKIDYKAVGIPAGAIVRINHKADCSSKSGNHVTYSYGDCTAEDVKSGSFNGLGGNQGDMVKVSTYPFAHICAVRWPPGVALPAKVLKSVNCKGVPSKTSESTR